MSRLRRSVSRLSVVLLVACVLRVLLWAVVAWQEPSRFVDADTPSYWSSAQALLEVGSFAVAPDRPTVMETGRTPGYPLFLAANLAVFGEGPSGPAPRCPAG